MWYSQPVTHGKSAAAVPIAGRHHLNFAVIISSSGYEILIKATMTMIWNDTASNLIMTHTCVTSPKASCRRATDSIVHYVSSCKRRLIIANERTLGARYRDVENSAASLGWPCMGNEVIWIWYNRGRMRLKYSPCINKDFLGNFLSRDMK